MLASYWFPFEFVVWRIARPCCRSYLQEVWLRRTRFVYPQGCSSLGTEMSRIPGRLYCCATAVARLVAVVLCTGWSPCRATIIYCGIGLCEARKMLTMRLTCNVFWVTSARNRTVAQGFIFQSCFSSCHETGFRAVRLREDMKHFEHVATGEVLPSMEKIRNMIKPGTVRQNSHLVLHFCVFSRVLAGCARELHTRVYRHARYLVSFHSDDLGFVLLVAWLPSEYVGISLLLH